MCVIAMILLFLKLRVIIFSQLERFLLFYAS